jgi:hypothetical protein
VFLAYLQPRSKRILAIFDFDVIGFFWLIRNTPKIGAAVTFWMALVAGVVLWLDAWLRD